MTSPRSKAKLKTYVIVFCCLNTGAVDLRLTPSYNTKDFLLQLSNHCLDHGNPSFIYTDSGSQLKAGKKVVAAKKDDKPEDEEPTIDWSEVMDTTAKENGITWRLAPPGCQHRNGRVERVVAASP